MTNEQISQQYYDKMIKTPVVKLVLQLGLPTTVTMLISGIYNMADTYFVGTLGESAQGAIGILFTLQSLIQAVAFMLGHGSGTYVSKELANRDSRAATKYVSTAFFAGGIFGLLFGVVGLICLEPFMRLLGSTDTILPYAKDYGMWVFASCPFMICSLVLNNNLRYEGKATYAMIGLVSGGVLNILLDFVFVVICDMGVGGAGMATAISQIVSFVLLLIFYEKMAQSSVSITAIAHDLKTYGEILKNGFPSFIRQGISCISSAILNNFAGIYGAMINTADPDYGALIRPDDAKYSADCTIAAMSIVNRIALLTMSVGLGIGQGLQPVASYNYQLKEYKRVKNALVATCTITLVAMIAICVPSMILAPHFVRLFQDNDLVVALGTREMHWAMGGLLFMPLFTPICMVYQSIRKAGTASFLAMLRNGLIFIPLLFLLSSLWHVNGVLLAQPLSDMITGVISVPFIVHFLTTEPKEKEDTQKQSTPTEF